MGACHVTSKAHTPFPEAPSDGWQAVEPEAEHEQDIGIEKVGDSLPFAVTSSAGKALAESDSGVPADAPADERSFLQKMADYVVSSRAKLLSPEEQFQASAEVDASDAALATADAPPETENTSIQKGPIPGEPEAAAEVEPEPIWRTKIWSSEMMIDEAMGAPAKAASPNGGLVASAMVLSDADKGKFALKDKDAAMAAAFAHLREQGAFPDDDDDDDDDDEMVFGDDDNLDDYE